jgi:hypothetical protein
MTQLPPTYPAVAPLVVVSDFADIVQISLCEAPPIFRDYVVETLGEVRGLFHISGNQHGAKVQGSWRWPTKEKPIKATKMFYKPCTPVDYVTPKLPLSSGITSPPLSDQSPSSMGGSGWPRSVQNRLLEFRFFQNYHPRFNTNAILEFPRNAPSPTFPNPSALGTRSFSATWELPALS